VQSASSERGGRAYAAFSADIDKGTQTVPDFAEAVDPLVNAAEPWRYAALTAPAIVLTLVGIAAFARRDIKSA